jgi:hypothetical protein
MIVLATNPLWLCFFVWLTIAAFELASMNVVAEIYHGLQAPCLLW